MVTQAAFDGTNEAAPLTCNEKSALPLTPFRQTTWTVVLLTALFSVGTIFARFFSGPPTSATSGERNVRGARVTPLVPVTTENPVATREEGQYTVGNMFFQMGVWRRKPVRLHNDRMDVFPGSIMLDYAANARQCGDIEVLADIVRKRIPTAEVSNSTALVIHLRMGDNVIRDDCWDTTCSFYGGSKNPLSKAQFEALGLLDGSKASRNVFTDVALFGSYNGGGWVHKRFPSNSVKYSESVKNYFESKGISIQNRLTEESAADFKTVDDDIIWITNHARYFVCSSGTFSTLLAELVRRNGGETFNCPSFKTLRSRKCPGAKRVRRKRPRPPSRPAQASAKKSAVDERSLASRLARRRRTR